MRTVRKQIGKQRDLPVGVNQSGKKWTAALRLEGKRKHLGTFATVEEASAAYETAKQEKLDARFEAAMRRCEEQGWPKEQIDKWRREHEWEKETRPAREAANEVISAAEEVMFRLQAQRREALGRRWRRVAHAFYGRCPGLVVNAGLDQWRLPKWPLVIRKENLLLLSPEEIAYADAIEEEMEVCRWEWIFLQGKYAKEYAVMRGRAA